MPAAALGSYQRLGRVARLFFMTGTKGAATLGELLNPAAWARRLARGLGTDAADDLAQEALVRALERPPVGK